MPMQDAAKARAFTGMDSPRQNIARLGQSANIIAIAKATNLSRQTVYRIRDDPAAAEAALATWEA